MTELSKEQRAQLVLNAYSERQLAAQRQALAGGGFNDTLGTKRQRAWQDYGFPNTLCFLDFLNLYQRNGLAKGVIDKIAAKTWQDNPWITEGDEGGESKAETPWERDTRQLFKRLGIYRALKDADRRRMVGQYSALILKVADDQDYSKPLQPGMGQLVGVMPVWQAQLEPTQWDTRLDSPRYGQVEYWQYHEAAVETADVPAPGRSVTVHHSRVVVIGDDREGASLLESAYNDFVSLEKVSGALGESYWKNAARQLNVTYDKDTSPESLAAAAGVDISDLHEELNGMFRDLNQGMDAGMVSFGGSATPLVANVPNPKDPHGVLVQNICAGLGVPSRIAIGNQSGERASTEDQKEFAQTCMSRRNGDVGEDVRRLIDHLMEYRLLAPVVEFSVMWSDLMEPTLADKLEAVGKMAEANQKALGSGEVVFSGDEMRAVAGYEASDDDI